MIERVTMFVCGLLLGLALMAAWTHPVYTENARLKAALNIVELQIGEHDVSVEWRDE